jgi:hypothetical protein
MWIFIVPGKNNYCGGSVYYILIEVPLPELPLGACILYLVEITDPALTFDPPFSLPLW